MRIFDRVRSRSHPLSDHLKELRVAGDESQVQACNIMHDPRVSPAREDVFLNFISGCDAEDTFAERFKDYSLNRIQNTDNPDFACHCNDNNEVDVPDEKMVSILNVNGLWSMFQWAVNEIAEGNLQNYAAEPVFMRFRNYSGHTRGIVPADTFMHDAMKDETLRKPFLQLVAAIYEVYRIKHPYNPIWLTPWNDFKRHHKRTKSPNRFCHLVGVPTDSKQGQWIVILKFEAKDLGKIYRPTVLDNTSFYHFPTPDVDEIKHGISVDLEMGKRVPSREYIAKMPSLEKSMADLNVKEDCHRLTGLKKCSLTHVRRYHIRCLRLNFRNLHALVRRRAIAWLNRAAGCKI